MKAYELLDKPEKWTKQKAARNSNGQACSVESLNAVCWCLWGAIKKVNPLECDLVHSKIYDATKGEFETAGEFNDAHTYEEVIALLKELDI